VAQAPKAKPQPATVKLIKGSYEYTGLKDNDARGREEWSVTVHPDGTRTAQATVDIRDLGHQSNAILRVDKRFRPLNAHLSFWRFGEFGGSGHYWLERTPSGDIVHGRVTGAQATASFDQPVPDNVSLRIHPVIMEGWLSWYHDNAVAGEQTGKILNIVTTNDMGPRGLGHMQDNVTKFLGRETVKTPAGAYEADRYSIYGGRYEVWLWGEERIAVRYTSPAAGREYRLTRLEVGP